MHPVEFWWLAEAKRPAKRYGSMSEAEARELYEFTYGGPPHG